MIPALLAVPMVQGLVGGVVGSVAHVFQSHQPVAPSPATGADFGSALQRAALSAPSLGQAGTLRSEQWNQMSSPEVQDWAQGLSGRHIDATDATGKTISGRVDGVQTVGKSFALNIGGHLVSLSQLKQISWSAPAL